ncbi:MAG: peptide ABC transporter substrate-binding protein [Anaerolineae bacterium]|nr:peptide ABC transporter substrate-binding protein [Anaerolineae bacterium]
MLGKRFCLVWVVLAALGGIFGPVTAQGRSIITIDFQQELDTLNPLYTGMWFMTTAADMYLSPPWYIDDTLTPVPALVTEIPSAANGLISEDNRSITLKLRDDIVWSDGEPITADDFVFTYEMLVSPNNAPDTRYPYDEKIESVVAADERTVVVTYTEPFAPWLTNTFHDFPPIPAHILRPVFEAEGTIDNAAWNRAADVVSGPFKPVEWVAGSHIAFERNENYWGEPAKFDGVFMRFVPEDATVVASLVSGDTDVGTFIAYSDTPALEDAGVNIELVNSGYNEGWFLNFDPETANPAMLDVNVRKAIVLAFDRDKFNQDINLGKTYTPASFWEGTPYKDPDSAPLPYDPDMANQLLDEAGWVDSNGDGVRDKDGVELVLRHITNQRQIRKDLQVIAQQQLAEVGIKLEIENYDSNIFFGGYADDAPMAKGRFDIAELSDVGDFPDPNVSRFLCSQIPSEDNPSGYNDQHYCNEQVDALFTEQAQTVDFDKRVELFHEIDRLMNADIAWAGIWYDPDLWAINSRISNTRVSGADPLWNIAGWEVSG